MIACAAGPVGTHPVLAIAGLEMLLIPEVDQRVEIGDALNLHIPALASIAAVGTSKLNKFFPPEGEAAISTVP
jgi:hypothetical protein